MHKRVFFSVGVELGEGDIIIVSFELETMENILSVRDRTLKERRGAECQGAVSSRGRNDMCDHNVLPGSMR